jgi:hypothetical protein
MLTERLRGLRLRRIDLGDAGGALGCVCVNLKLPSEALIALCLPALLLQTVCSPLHDAKGQKESV